jgi:hypothetical protein
VRCPLWRTLKTVASGGQRPLNWGSYLEVLGTAETPQIDQGVHHQLQPVVALLDGLEPEDKRLHLSSHAKVCSIVVTHAKDRARHAAQTFTIAVAHMQALPVPGCGACIPAKVVTLQHQVRRAV